MARSKIITRKYIKLTGKLLEDPSLEGRGRPKLVFIDSLGRFFKVGSNLLDRRLKEYLNEVMLIEGTVDVFKKRDPLLKINYFKIVNDLRKETNRPATNIEQAS